MQLANKLDGSPFSVDDERVLATFGRFLAEAVSKNNVRGAVVAPTAVG
jgi:hypothetical protein